MKTVLATLHSKYIHASLALPCLAAWCGDACGEIVIREFTDHEPKESIAAQLLAEQPDVVTFSVYIWNRGKSLELVDLLHATRPDLRIVVGGPEISFDGEPLFHAHPGLSAVVCGEGELPFQSLLQAWSLGEEPRDVPRLNWRGPERIHIGPDGPTLSELDRLPSPFHLGLVDLLRGFSYYESSRGCPYRCSFCMSALDDRVRTFGMQRIKDDLALLIDNKVPKIKLVDRTFNYDAQRAREIFRFIIERNTASHFHFEIGAHLLDEPTIALLEQVPAGMFQFEIGVQSTLPETLQAIGRNVSSEKVLENVAALQKRTRVDLHLDLIAGLPGESYTDLLAAIDSVLKLTPQHLQIEPVKLLPGSQLRADAARLGLRFDPHPPYTIVGSPDLAPDELERIRQISRLLDLTWNSGRLRGFLAELGRRLGGMAAALEALAGFLEAHAAFRFPLGQNALFEQLWQYLRSEHPEDAPLREQLARDYALCERVLPDRVPDFFNPDLTAQEQVLVRAAVRDAQASLRADKVKLQYFAARFKHLPPHTPHLRLFLYLTRSNLGREVVEQVLAIEPD